MRYETIRPLHEEEFKLVRGGSHYAEPGTQYLIPPSVGPIGPDGQPTIFPGIQLPPIYSA